MTIKANTPNEYRPGTPLTRQEVEAWNPRPGWMAVNVDADSGRVFHYLPGQTSGYYVDWNWDDHYAAGHGPDGWSCGQDGEFDAVLAVMAEAETAWHSTPPTSKEERTP